MLFIIQETIHLMLKIINSTSGRTDCFQREMLCYNRLWSEMDSDNSPVLLGARSRLLMGFVFLKSRDLPGNYLTLMNGET